MLAVHAAPAVHGKRPAEQYYSIPRPRRRVASGSGQPSARTRRARPRATRSVSHTVRRIGSRTHRAHILYTHSAWHIRPVAAPGFGPRCTADNTARTIRHIAASAAPSSLSATRTRCGTQHDSSSYTSGAFPSPATAPHAFVAASTRHRATSPRHRATAPPRHLAAFLRLRFRLSTDFAPSCSPSSRVVDRRGHALLGLVSGSAALAAALAA